MVPTVKNVPVRNQKKAHTGYVRSFLNIRFFIVIVIRKKP